MPGESGLSIATYSAEEDTSAADKPGSAGQLGPLQPAEGEHQLVVGGIFRRRDLRQLVHGYAFRTRDLPACAHPRKAP